MADSGYLIELGIFAGLNYPVKLVNCYIISKRLNMLRIINCFMQEILKWISGLLLQKQ